MPLPISPTANTGTCAGGTMRSARCVRRAADHRRLERAPLPRVDVILPEPVVEAVKRVVDLADTRIDIHRRPSGYDQARATAPDTSVVARVDHRPDRIQLFDPPGHRRFLALKYARCPAARLA